MTAVNVLMDLSTSFGAPSTPSATMSSPAPHRAALAPLQNHNFPSATPKNSSSKPSTPVAYTPYSRPQPLRLTLKSASSSSSEPSGEPASAPLDTTPPAVMVDTASPSRATFLEQFDYVEMRCKLTRTELPKKPYYNELGVIFHSPAEPSVTYDTFFQTTHSFLDLSSTLHMFPTFVDLPLNLRPSKNRYDSTKQSEDLMLRVRCLFCRGRFGGKNAKAIWERHVKEHWPKQDRVKEYTKEEPRRPMRQIQKRPTGSNAHSRTRSHDSSAWAPNARYNGSTGSPCPSSYSSSSRASSPGFESPYVYPIHDAPLRTTSPTSFQQASSCSGHDSDVEPVEPSASFFRSPIRSPRKRTSRPRAHPYSRHPPSSDYTDDEEEDHVMISNSQTFWDIDADLDAIGRAAQPCLSKDQFQAALDAIMSRVEEVRSPIKPSLRLVDASAITAVPASPLKQIRQEINYPVSKQSHDEYPPTEADSASEESGSGSSGEESSDSHKSFDSASCAGSSHSEDSVMVDQVDYPMSESD